MPDAEKMMLTPMDIGLQTMEPYLSPADRALVQAQFGAYLGKPSHPVLVSNAFVNVVAAAGFPTLSLPEARRQMAHISVAQYRQTILGRVMFAPIRLMGLERVLRQAPRQFAAVTNYGTRSVTEIGPNHWWFECEDELMHPETMTGNLEAVAELVHVRDVRVVFSQIAARHYGYDITWGRP